MLYSTNSSATPHTQISIINISTTTTAMDAAIDACRASEAPNFSQIASEYGVNRITLTRRFKGQ